MFVFQHFLLFERGASERSSLRTCCNSCCNRCQAPYKCLLLNMLIINTLDDPGLEEGHDGLNQVYGHNCATSYG